MSTPVTVSMDAPAKINIGLEILGRRPDGYHDIQTVMAMLELSDSLEFTAGGTDAGMDLPSITAETNLISLALRAYRRAVPGSPRVGWRITKRIPAAAGLGGASADAAAALHAANMLAGDALSSVELAALAGTLGSDIPFFLGTPVAIASGRGTDLVPMPVIDQPVTLIVPRVVIAEKTRTLYSLIGPEDMSDGTRIRRVSEAIGCGRLPLGADIANAFSRPLAVLVPEIRDLQVTLGEHGIDRVVLSGAGPAHYVIGDSDCSRLATACDQDRRFDAFDIIPTRSRLVPMTPRSSMSHA